MIHPASLIACLSGIVSGWLRALGAPFFHFFANTTRTNTFRSSLQVNYLFLRRSNAAEVFYSCAHEVTRLCIRM